MPCFPDPNLQHRIVLLGLNEAEIRKGVAEGGSVQYDMMYEC